MLLPMPMKKVRLLVTRDDAPQAALLLACLRVFQTDEERTYTKELPELPAAEYQEKVKDAAAYLDKILHYLQQTLPPTPLPLPEPPGLEQVMAIAGELAGTWQRFSHMEEQQRRLQEQDKRLTQLEDSLESFQHLNIDLGLLNVPHTFLDIRVGTVPLENVRRLSEALSLAGYRLESFFAEQDIAYTLIAGPSENYAQIARALVAAGWRAQTVPSEFAGYPDEMRQSLEQQRTPIRKEQERLEQERDKAWRELRPTLVEAAGVLLVAGPYAELGKELRGRGALALLSGWVPASDMVHLRQSLEERFAGRYILSSRDPSPSEREQVPTALRHRRWLKPFAALVENYGMPRYGELDPTLLFALTFVAMFGMMFGDVGHGLLIAAAGVALHKRIGDAMPFMVLCGLSSAFFGMLYGSFFGSEALFHPLWISPLSDPVLMLSVALAAGISLIAMATLLTIRNYLVDGRVGEALLGGKGLAGLLLYAGLCYISYRTFHAEAIGSLAYLAVGLASFSILFHIWQVNSESGVGERLLITLVEGFDTLMGYISGTLSFLRISAFSLNHVALAIAVYTIANTMDGMGYWLAVVLGNLVIVVLEGAIVMIQALRLEYYEGFSRFLSGSGHAFRPLRLHRPLNRMAQKIRTTP